jgi:hypothetical protein
MVALRTSARTMLTIRRIAFLPSHRARIRPARDRARRTSMRARL